MFPDVHPQWKDADTSEAPPQADKSFAGILAVVLTPLRGVGQLLRPETKIRFNQYEFGLRSCLVRSYRRYYCVVWYYQQLVNLWPQESVAWRSPCGLAERTRHALCCAR